MCRLSRTVATEMKISLQASPHKCRDLASQASLHRRRLDDRCYLPHISRIDKRIYEQYSIRFHSHVFTQHNNYVITMPSAPSPTPAWCPCGVLGPHLICDKVPAPCSPGSFVARNLSLLTAP